MVCPGFVSRETSPEPESECERGVSMNHPDHAEGPLVPVIRQRIGEAPAGAIRFYDYMQLCLYEPEYGYYMKKHTKIGKSGDYYTASNIGDILGGVLARFIAGQAEEIPDGEFAVTEWGAGSGRLAGQILDAIQKERPDLYERLHYRIIEKSPFHRQLQEEELERHWSRAVFTEPDGGLSDRYPPGVVLSNELLDAFPVYRVRRRGGELMELYVTWDRQEERFRELELPCGDQRLADYLAEGPATLLDGQTADINLEAAEWIGGQLARMTKGALITIDYGGVAEELFASHRMAGTLMCYKGHEAYDNPYIYAGEQDITAHVDFSALIRAGAKAGAADWKLMTQKEFLLENGVMELLMQHDGRDPFSPAARRNRAVRQLLVSDQMSELFKVLVQRKAGSGA